MTWDLKDQEAEKIGRKILKIMEIEVNYYYPLSSRFPTWKAFQEAAAEEIINKLFNASEKEKLTNLIEKLDEEEFGKISLIPNASNWIKGYINKHIGTVTGKIFKIIHNEISPHALNLLGIIKLEAEHFPESYRNFSQLLTELRTEHGNHYEMATVKGYFSVALEELRYFVEENKNAENTSKPKTNEQDQTGENNSPEQDKNSPPKTPSNQNNNNRNQRLENLRAKTITEISQAISEAKLTDQDLAETDRQWKSLINNSSDTIYINSLKENLLAVIQQIKKEKIDSGKLSELIQRGKGTDNPTELKNIIEETEKYRGEKSYTSLKAEINALKEKLAKQDIEGYCNAIIEMITQELENEAIKETELDEEVQKNLKKLKKGGIQQVQIDKIKDEVSNNIKLKSAKKKLEKILEDYQKNPSEEKKQEILAFISSTNSFYQEVCKAKKNEIDSLLKNGGSPQKKESSESNFPIKPKYIIGGMAIIAVIFVFIEIFKKKKPRSYRT